MKKLFTILAVIAAIFAILLAVLPISNLAVFPAGAALIFGLLAFYFSKKQGEPLKKIIPFSFLLTICALVLTTYKAVFVTTEVENIEDLENTELQLEEQAIEELEGLEIDDLEIENLDIDPAEIEADIKIEETTLGNPATEETIPEPTVKADEIKDIKINEAELNDLEFDESDLDDFEMN
ncbi:MAG: hypothetical protein ACK5NB_03170 [Flavobacteriaceae bacterium]